MTVEEIRGSFGVEDENNDKFPVGMRVLAVDDDPTCLKLLEGLLRKCQYQGLIPLCFACFFSMSIFISFIEIGYII